MKRQTLWARRGPWLAAAGFIMIAAWPPASARAAVAVLPGQTIHFAQPDGTTQTSTLVGSPICEANPQAEVLSSRAVFSQPLQNGKCEVIRFWDFTLDGDPNQHRVLQAQISGEVILNGFLSTVLDAHIKTAVVIELRDETNGGQVVAAHVVTEHELEGELHVGMGMEPGAAIGSATVVEGEGHVSFELSGKLDNKIVRDESPFGFVVLLERGHHYRLEAKLETQGRIGTMGGRAVSHFYDLMAALPDNLFDPAVWLDSLQLPIADLALPNVPLPPVPAAITIPAVTMPAIVLPKLTVTVLGNDYTVTEARTIHAAATLLPETALPLLPDFDYTDSNAILEALGFPTSLRDVANSPQLGLHDFPIHEPQIEGVGAQIKDLQLMVQSDTGDRLDSIQSALDTLVSIQQNRVPNEAWRPYR